MKRGWDGSKERLSFQEFKANFCQPDMIYAPYAFWFWDQKVETLGIKPEDMARELGEKGINPGYAHARENYADTLAGETSGVYPIAPEEWLSEAWFSAVERVVRQADADGSHFSFADEFGWPSLQAGGRILKQNPDMAAKTLWVDICDVKPGESVPLKKHFFAVSARLIRWERTGYVEFCGAGWKKIHNSWDASRAFEIETVPYNFAAKYTDMAGDKAIFHLTVPKDGTYCLYSRWCDCGGNSSRVVYSVNEQIRFVANQKENGMEWKKLGEIPLRASETINIVMQNEAEGIMCVDAISLASEGKMKDAIIVDDWNTKYRRMGYIDADTLSVVSEKTRGSDGRPLWMVRTGYMYFGWWSIEDTTAVG